ncbi:MAG: class I SAM-dependent methyltransferase [Mesorhizobium sp.]|nr:MAG: class I SAM-dependent methyltransferase [Mesorhizobium sp.]
MGRRSNFPRNPKDFYSTPAMALPPLLSHLPTGVRYLEPTAGNGALMRALAAHGHVCGLAIDLHPEGPDILRRDALTLTPTDVANVDMVIGNLPWSWQLFRPLLGHLLTLNRPIWILRDTAWAFNLRSATLIDHCALMQPTRRLRWIPGTPDTAKDDTAWFSFEPGHHGGPRLLPRIAEPGRRGQHESRLNPQWAVTNLPAHS